jgi:hypothetical protein
MKPITGMGTGANGCGYRRGSAAYAMSLAVACTNPAPKGCTFPSRIVESHQSLCRVAMRMLDESLTRLQTDHLDLWQIHEVIDHKDPELSCSLRLILNPLLAAHLRAFLLNSEYISGTQKQCSQRSRIRARRSRRGQSARSAPPLGPATAPWGACL